MSTIIDGTTVSGKVSKVFMYRDGMAIKIEVKNTVKGYATPYTAWGIDGTIVSEGDRVTVRGNISAKPSTYTKKDGTEGTGTDFSINDPQIIEHERLPGAQAAAPADFAPVGDDTPF